MEKAKNIRQQILGLLDDRKGFSNWFDDIDEDLKQEIVDGIDHIIAENLSIKER